MIALGSDVYGREGKLGELSRLIVDPEANAVAALVVRHGSIMPIERIVPLPEAVDREDGTVYVDATNDAFSEYGPFSEDAYRAPDPDYTGPPGWDAATMGVENLQYLGAVALGPVSFGNAARPLGFPGAESESASPLPASVHSGSSVLDVNGVSVGKVADFETDETTGAPVRLVVRDGVIRRHERDVPVDWVDHVEDDIVVLNRSKAEVERLAG